MLPEISPNLPFPKGGDMVPPLKKGRCEKIGKKVLDIVI
jgi:hypothetical protein